MMNGFTMLRMEDTVPGNMIKRPVKFSWVDPKSGRIMTTWMDYRTYEFEMQYQDDDCQQIKQHETDVLHDLIFSQLFRLSRSRHGDSTP